MSDGVFAHRAMRVTACLIVFMLCGSISGSLFAERPVPPIRLVDMHTAGVVEKGSFVFESRIYENAGTGFLLSIAAGITDRFCFGLGYGAEGIVGRSEDVHFNPYPGCLVKYRLLEENYVLPGIALGFDYQGFGGIGDEGRFGYYGYMYKSEGFFAAVSKSYLFLRVLDIGLHGDVNFSFEEIDRVKWPNLGIGTDLGVSDKFSFVAEYDFGLSTRDPFDSASVRDDAYTLPYEGYLNVGLRIHFTPEFSLEFDARDLLQNRTYLINRGNGPVETRVGWSRELKVTFIAPIRG
jgi:hypothetical protein